MSASQALEVIARCGDLLTDRQMTRFLNLALRG